MASFYSFVDEDVVAFVDRFRRRNLLDNLQLVVITVELSRNVWCQTLLDAMAPRSIKSLEGYLQQYLQRCSSLEYIQVWDAFDHNNLDRGADGKPMNDKEGWPLYRTLIDWVTLTYAIGHDNKPFNGITEENAATNEAFRYKQDYHFQLRRGPRALNGRTMAKKDH
ncbi:hypothetical protein niasHS_006488 [Heterodera schachtii]|uniref:Uncharacterized protein n=1 Tax=Heterodera schachtii TaxID=97005 RepID=A0ABD2JHD6_HETSC